MKDQQRGIVQVAIDKEMEQSYLDYAMSVIVGRALPDCRDGLKPVHRRILYAMYNTGNNYDKPYRKSARVVGEVMGKYHPHGDMPIYGALVRMAQDFSLRAPLIDGQGNFGSIDGDSPAQMRYTEARLQKISTLGLLIDIDNDTVDFSDNYDGSEQEPVILPARYPNLLVNGSNGIAVGMATNVPTHNLGEVIDACCAYLDNENITIDELVCHVPAPDFPSGGEILSSRQSRTAMMTGRGGIAIRGIARFENIGTHHKSIVISEIPYQVNKAELVKSIETLSTNKTIEGIAEIRDETNKLGIRIVVELKRDIEPEVVLNQLYRCTQLQTSFGVNMLALRDGIPIVMNLLDIISSFIKFREEVVTRRTKYLLSKARDRAHILVGLLLALENIDNVISLIRSSKDTAAARDALLKTKWSAKTAQVLIKLVDNPLNRIEEDEVSCYLSDDQVKAILEMKLQRLTGLEYDKIANELNNLSKEINYFQSILESRTLLMGVIRQELIEIKTNFGTPRLTKIIDVALSVDDEDLIQEEEVVVVVTKNGYIKRTPLDQYKTQRRGGKGRSAMNVYEDDIITKVIVSCTHDALLFFSNYGKVYKMKVYKLPSGSMQSKGRAIINMLSLSDPEEKITNIITLSKEICKVKQKEYFTKNDKNGNGIGNIVENNEINIIDDELDLTDLGNINDHSSIAEDIGESDNNDDDEVSILFATMKGKIRRNSLRDFYNIPSSGKIAIRLSDGDRLIGVITCTSKEHVLLATKQGKAVRFPVTDVRIFKSRTSDGVTGVTLSLKDDAVVSLSILKGINIEFIKREELLKIEPLRRIKIANLLSTNNTEQITTSIIDIAKKSDIDLSIINIEELIYYIENEEFIITINDLGFGKRTSAYEYRVVKRGSKGIINMNLSTTSASIISSTAINENDEILIFSKNGTVIRTAANQIRIAGRDTLGVRLMSFKNKNEIISSISVIFATYDEHKLEEIDISDVSENIDDISNSG